MGTPNAAAGSGAAHDAAIEGNLDAIIVGAGFGGVGVAVELKKMGIDNFVILEKADDFGGTWQANTYPGLAVDVPCMLFSYQGELNPDWSRIYAPGQEIKAYCAAVADKYELRKNMRFGEQVVDARFDPDASVWRVRTADGEVFSGTHLMNACGFLSDPQLPEIEGLDDFTGKIIHTARWDHDYDLANKRVALIGTGASAIQLGPEIAPLVQRLDVYQRTAIWLTPKMDRPVPPAAQRIMRRFPVTMKLFRAGLWAVMELSVLVTYQDAKRYRRIGAKIEATLRDFVRREVNDPETAAKLIPDYSFFCKRPSFSNTFYPMFNRPNVNLITEPITRATPTGIVTGDGTTRDVDVIICATGFRTYAQRGAAPMFEITGEGGKNLRDWWDENRYQAYLGTTVPDFPNLFLIWGPYAAVGTSYFDILQHQLVHIRRVLRAARSRHANYAVIKKSAHDKEFRTLRRRSRKLVLYAGNCASSNTYYLDWRGDSPGGPRPGSQVTYWLTTRLFRLSNYRFETRRGHGDRVPV